MSLSVFDLFSVGIGPSSSHTVGPMKAAYAFAESVKDKNPAKIRVELFGSLALTGKGHGTDKAIYHGLAGQQPHLIEPNCPLPHLDTFELIFHKDKLLPKHTNGMLFIALDQHNNEISHEIYYSIGGGFIVTDKEYGHEKHDRRTEPYPFNTAEELLAHCRKHQLTIAELMMINEKTWQNESDIKSGLLHIAGVMQDCIERGCHTEGHLPGFLQVKRRAPDLYKKLCSQGSPKPSEYADVMHWLNVYAMAVNEENASGGRIVTAPTNGAAGIIPSVLSYYRNFTPNANDNGVIQFLLTAGAIAMLYKKGASISGAEVGCQGEVGVASSMAAGALTAVLGGTLSQIEKSAEIAMEHHLGMTCDPIGGFVQIPCIERNAMGSVKAVNATRIALMEDADGGHKVSLDKVIAAMRQTGKDMMSIYKETSLGGLAAAIKDPQGVATANIPEC